MNSFAAFPDCVFLIDKSVGWTSFDVVNKMRRLLGVKKVGHAGTLDPAATGLLIVCSGKMTKQIDTYQNQFKIYSGSFRLGFTTASYDGETEAVPSGNITGLTMEKLNEAAKTFIGDIKQTPPMYSALKVNGKKLYELARKGVEIERKQRDVVIEQFQLTDFTGDTVSFTVHCSKGTYIRSLAHDFGQLLGCGAYLSGLRREAIGDFSVRDAWTIDTFAEKIHDYHESVREH